VTDYSDEAYDAIQAIYSNPSLDSLADRLDAALDDFEATPGAARFRRHRMQHDPAVYWFSISGSGTTVTVLWEPTPGTGAFVHFVGDGLA
jgi:hypothetical protein